MHPVRLTLKWSTRVRIEPAAAFMHVASRFLLYPLLNKEIKIPHKKEQNKLHSQVMSSDALLSVFCLQNQTSLIPDSCISHQKATDLKNICVLLFFFYIHIRPGSLLFP